MFKSLKAIASPLLLVLDPLVTRSRNRNVAMISAEVSNGLMLDYVTIKYGLLKYRIRSCLITSPTSQFIDMRAMPRTLSGEGHRKRLPKADRRSIAHEIANFVPFYPPLGVSC